MYRIAESLYHTSETIALVYVNFTGVKNKIEKLLNLDLMTLAYT